MKKIALLALALTASFCADTFQKSSGDIFSKNSSSMKRQIVSEEVKEQIKQNNLKFQRLKDCDKFGDDDLAYRDCVSGVQKPRKQAKINKDKLGKISKEDKDYALDFYNKLPKPNINVNKIEKMQGTNVLSKKDIEKIKKDGKRAIGQ